MDIGTVPRCPRDLASTWSVAIIACKVCMHLFFDDPCVGVVVYVHVDTVFEFTDVSHERFHTMIQLFSCWFRRTWSDCDTDCVDLKKTLIAR
jgi:hypothetical protein